MKTLVVVTVALALALAIVPAVADGTAGAMGILYATHTDTLSLQTSYRVCEYQDWQAYADVFWAPAVETVGGGVSVAPPEDTPVVRQILAITSADRIGFGLHYHDSWQGTVYIVKDVLTY